MQTETGRIIYYLTDFKSRQDQLKDRPYMIFEDMAVVFGILDADRYTVHPIDVRQASYIMDGLQISYGKWQKRIRQDYFQKELSQQIKRSLGIQMMNRYFFCQMMYKDMVRR